MRFKHNFNKIGVTKMKRHNIIKQIEEKAKAISSLIKQTRETEDITVFITYGGFRLTIDKKVKTESFPE